MKRFLLSLVFVLLLAGPAWAACSGSGLTWSCTSGSAMGDNSTGPPSGSVAWAVGQATSGGTVTLANGSYSWSAYLLIPQGKSITIRCATVRGCTITGGGYFDYGANSSPTGQNYTQNAKIRISGFIFARGGSSNQAIWLTIKPGYTLSDFRIDNNTFSNASTGATMIFTGCSSCNGESAGYLSGVIDSNIFTGSTNYMWVKNLSFGNAIVGAMGGSQNVFVEDNTATFTNYNDNGTGCVDSHSGGMVYRYNTSTNCRFVSHSYCHGPIYNAEVYGNTITIGDHYRPIHHQGSMESIYFNNNIDATYIEVQHFRGQQTPGEGDCGTNWCDGTKTTGDWIDGNRSPIATYRGYPCKWQPGRNSVGTLKPLYQWNNLSGTTQVTFSMADDNYAAYQLHANRDYYEAVSKNAQTSPTSPFNGTVGMGFGTKANRPATCTPTPEALDAGQGGVGYWATDEGYWNSKTPGTPSGVLYRCSATNTWTLHYVPYPYPHPLRSGLASPTGLTVK